MGLQDTTAWQGKALVPQDYNDVAAMVRLARDVGDHSIEFDWSFREDDLRSLRKVANDWGHSDQGRYKCFDARVVAAINTALVEPDSIYAVNEPKASQSLDCVVRCEARDGLFHLHGHAPFNVVFGYAHGITSDDPTARDRLGPAACATIENAVRALGWDLARLTEERLRPFWNALFGFPVAHGVKTVVPQGGPESVVAVHFQGPFAAVEGAGDRCLFTDPIAKKSGVYLWTIEVQGQHRAHYAGQTRRSFGQRIAEHVSGILTGQYDTLDVATLDHGRPRVAWRAGEGGLSWPQDLPRFLGRREELVRATHAMIDRLRFHVAVVEGDAHLHNRIEGAIGRQFKKHADTAVSDFFGPGIKLPAKIPNDTPLRLVISSEMSVAGMPTTLIE